MQVNKMKNKTKIIYGSMLLALLLVFPLISAIGVGSPYAGAKMPLKMYPGESKDVLLNLQNFDVDEDMAFKGEILIGGEIAVLEQEDYTVPFESRTVYAKMVVSVPSSASIGDTYQIRYKFKQASFDSPEGGMISMAQGIERGFDVIVVEKPPEPVVDVPVMPEEPQSSGNMMMWIIITVVVVIIVVVVVIIIIKKKKAGAGGVTGTPVTGSKPMPPVKPAAKPDAMAKPAVKPVK